MLLKIVVVVLFFSYQCLAINIIYPDDFDTTTIIDEDGTTIDPITLLEQLKIERYELHSKQLANTTSINGTGTGTGTPPSTISNVTNAVTSTVSTVYNRIPCQCFKGQCGCCSGSLLASFNQKACLNITYEPDDFAFNAALSLNGRVFYKNRISGKNPPPICIRIPRIRVIRLCARFSNVYFTGPNMHVCVGMEANWDDFTLFDALLNCFRVGAAGVAIVSPEDGGGISSVTDEDDDDDDDDFDYDDDARGFQIGFRKFRNKLR